MQQLMMFFETEIHFTLSIKSSPYKTFVVREGLYSANILQTRGFFRSEMLTFCFKSRGFYEIDGVSTDQRPHGQVEMSQSTSVWTVYTYL